MSPINSSPIPSKRVVAIVQSNYLPWRGYFDLIRSADEFVLLDTVQYTRRDWRNRNIIKTPAGPQWITIPVEGKGKYFQRVDETRVSDPDWATKHIRAIELNYRFATAFADEAPWLFDLLSNLAKESMLSRVNERILAAIAARLKITTPIRRDSEFISRPELNAMNASERLIALCRATNADRYLSGPAARGYLDETLFAASGIELVWMDYNGYPEYVQLWGRFEPFVSIVDLLLNVGADAAGHFKRDDDAAFNC